MTKSRSHNQRTSPKSWNRAFSPRKTPAVVGPEFKPTRKDSSAVPYNVFQIKRRRIEC